MLAAIPAIAGCGSDDVLSPEAIAEAADKTASKGGARIAMEQTMTVPSRPPVSMTGSGLIDPKAMRGRIKIDTSEVIFERFTMYMRSPEGKRWLKIDLDQAGKAAGMDLGALVQQGQDPTQSLRYLKAASGDVKRVDEEDVRGVKTTHYKATIDLRRYPDVVPAKDRESVRRTIEQVIKLAGTHKAPMEVWIGEDGVVRRLKQTIRTLLGSGVRGTIAQRIELFDFGTPVDVRPPPANEVQDVTDVAAKGIRSLNE